MHVFNTALVTTLVPRKGGGGGGEGLLTPIMAYTERLHPKEAIFSAGCLQKNTEVFHELNYRKRYGTVIKLFLKNGFAK